MSISTLSDHRTPREPESPGARIARLQAEARVLGAAHVEALTKALGEVVRLSAEVADGGDAYPVGARELARKLTDPARANALTLTALMERER